MLVYTSGTTGPPKGAMLSHRNLLVTTDKLRRHFGLDRHTMEVLCYLPLCHVAERAFSTVMHLVTGGVVNFAESIDTVRSTCARSRRPCSSACRASGRSCSRAS